LRSKSAMLMILAGALAGPGAARAEDQPPRPVAKPHKAKTAKTQPPSNPAPPCARGQWKDDPVCFGENDPSALPTPSSSGGASRAGDVTLTPKAAINGTPRAQQDPIPFSGNLPTPKPSNNDFGGGLGVNFPF